MRYVDAIYEASATRLLGLVQATEESVGSLMLIGHGPGLPGLAESLGARPEPRTAWARLDTKYPTAGLAVLRLSGPWAAAFRRRGRAGRLRGTPRLRCGKVSRVTTSTARPAGGALTGGEFDAPPSPGAAAG